MKLSQFIRLREDARNALREEIENLRNEKRAALNKMLAKTLRDSSTWYDVYKLPEQIKLIINPDVGDKLNAFRESINFHTDFSDFYRFIIPGEGDIECRIKVTYPMTFDPRLKIVFLMNEDLSKLDLDNIVELSANYLENKADEMLNELKK
jgi:hypothetical protein